jgi:hypothetical protein
LAASVDLPVPLAHVTAHDADAIAVDREIALPRWTPGPIDQGSTANDEIVSAHELLLFVDVLDVDAIFDAIKADTD